jgi:hypothetical protein
MQALADDPPVASVRERQEALPKFGITISCMVMNELEEDQGSIV